MWLKILCVVLVARSVVGEEFLAHLHGAGGGNRMLLCLQEAPGRRARACPGALLHRECLAVSAACLRGHPPSRLLALRAAPGIDTCDDVAHAYSTRNTRGVTEHLYHPWADLVLVVTDRPYFNLALHPNSTRWTVSRTFKTYGIWRWMAKFLKQYDLARDVNHHYKKVMQGMAGTRSPLLLFLLAIVLPSVLLVIVFIYTIFYSHHIPELPYKQLTYIKEAIHV